GASTPCLSRPPILAPRPQGFPFQRSRGKMMVFDQNQVTPGGKTYAQIDAEQAEYVRRVNVALAAVRDKGARWSSYSASQSTFERLVGEPYAGDNVVLSMPACDSVAGPVEWPAQKIEVLWRCNGQGANRAWEFEIRDDGVGFRAVGRMFRWRRGYDVWAQ